MSSYRILLRLRAKLHGWLQCFTQPIFNCIVVALLSCAATGVSQTQQNGYISLTQSGSSITSLRFDATGAGNYGAEMVTGAGLRSFSSVSLSGNTLSLGISGGVLWDLPFLRTGYYDSDAHLNYPNDTNTAGATALTLPFRALVGSSGNTVRIEHFKRLPLGTYFLGINLQAGSRLLVKSDLGQNWDLDTSWPGCTQISYIIQNDRITLQGTGASGTMQISAVSAGSRDVPGNAFAMPKASFTPDTAITYAPTGKSVPISRLVSELMQMGTYWAPSTPPGGEWVIGTEIHLFDDPRSWYLNQLRTDLLSEQRYIGYDRFGHFGYQYAWGRYPDYGAGGLLNVPPGNATNDMRHLHINGARIQAIVKYVLATRDTSLLRARRARYVSTNGAEAQPLCGAGAELFDYVLASGDVRLDGNAATVKDSLGQEFTATQPFTSVSALVGNPSLSDANHGKLTVYSSRGGTQLGQVPFSISPNISQNVTVSVGSRPAGKYYVELTDDDSGTRYFGPGVVWWTKLDANYAGGDAWNGPMRCEVEAELLTLFNYLREYMGGAAYDLIYYANDPQYNVPQHKSGRNGVCMPNSYYEGAGGSFDAYAGIWYNEACGAMADMYECLGNPLAATNYRNMRTAADQKYRTKYWRQITENGLPVGRFYACADWDGVIRDYGHTHNNLEAAARGIATPDMARQILSWLDRGQYSANGGTVWTDHIYSLWDLVPPWNTRANSTWLNVTGTLPYTNVLTNGGARLDTCARDLMTRTKYLSIDNMQERNERILSRFASPDRLTGGRSYDDPGGRGRWFFLGPNSNVADLEGFREIFWGNGAVASYQPAAYFGMELKGTGLLMHPRVPSDFTSVKFDNIGFWKSLFTFTETAQRTTVINQSSANSSYTIPQTNGGVVGQTFTAASRFTKAGVLISVTPFTSKQYNELSLLLERQNASSGWDVVGQNWYSHIRNNQWAWVSADQFQPAGLYRIKIYGGRAASGETVAVRYTTSDAHLNGSAFLSDGAPGSISGDLAFQVIAERTALTAECTYNPGGRRFDLVGARALSSYTDLGSGLHRVAIMLDPDESVTLLEKSALTKASEWQLY